MISGNTFSGNGSFPVGTAINQVGSIGVNTYGTNGTNAIEVAGGAVSQDLTMKKDTVPYIVTSSINVYISSVAASTLTIEPGVTVKFNQYTGLYIGNGTNQGVSRAAEQ